MDSFIICNSGVTSGIRMWSAMLKASVLFVVVGNCLGLPVETTPTTSPASISTKRTNMTFLRVKNTIPSWNFDVAALSEGDSLQSKLCEYAGPAPQIEDIPALAVSWLCESVEDGAITLPGYVYKMKPHNTELWIRMRENCDCQVIRYSIPYLRYEESTKTWMFSTRKVPVGTSCPDYDSELCKKVLEL